MSDPVILAAKIVLSELDAWERSKWLPRLGSPIEHGASLERAIVNLKNAVEAHEALERFVTVQCLNLNSQSKEP